MKKIYLFAFILSAIFLFSTQVQAADGDCGTSNAGSFVQKPSTNLCTTGTPTTVTGNGPWDWQCLGSAGGSTSSCVAFLSTSDGDCGTSNAGSFVQKPSTNLCTTGTPTTVTGNGPWEWQCIGTNGGSTSSCVAFLSTSDGSGTGIVKLMKGINKVILNPLIIFLFACALMFFLYGVMQFVINPANEEMKKKGKSHMIWGVVGMVIMVSVFGIMQIILNTLGGSKTGIQIDRTGNYKIEINK